MYEMGCFSPNGFYPNTSSCSSNTSSPDSMKHQRLLVAATPSPPNVSHQFYPSQQQQYPFDHHRFRLPHISNNNINNNNNNNSNSNGSSEIHSSSSSTTSSHDQLPLWLTAQSSGQQAQQQQQSRFSSDLLHF